MRLDDSAVSTHAALLDDEERARADRFLSADARTRFVASRGIVRQILSLYLDTPPRDVTLATSPSGKPELRTPSREPSQLRFNLSHTGWLGLCAVTCSREVGVDVEAIKPHVAVHDLARCFFSSVEVTALRALAEPLQARGFFACWVRKEALAKARGVGLRAPLNSFSVTVSPDEPASLLSAESPAETRRWSITSLPTGEGYEAALAIEGDGWQLRLWDWTDDLRTRDESGSARPIAGRTNPNDDVEH